MLVVIFLSIFYLKNILKFTMTEFSKIIGLVGPQMSVCTSYMPADLITIRYQQRSWEVGVSEPRGVFFNTINKKLSK